jgi:hypothetical protein
MAAEAGADTIVESSKIIETFLPERPNRPIVFSRIRHGKAWISRAQVFKKKGSWRLQK